MRRMGEPASDAERLRVADELRRVREAAGDAAGAGALAELPPHPEPSPPAALPRVTEAAAVPPPSRPDGGAVAALAAAQPAPGGRSGLLARWVRRLLAPSLDAQAAFNVRQARLDAELLDYVDARFDETHRHYDHVLGLHGRRMNEIDERHVLLQRELVSHVHDIVRRIDLVLSGSERGRISLESALRDVRARLARIEERLHGG